MDIVMKRYTQRRASTLRPPVVGSICQIEVVTNKIKEGIVKRSKASKLPETFLVRPNRLFSSCQNSVVITVFGSKMS